MTERTLRRLVATWQRRLGLEAIRLQISIETFDPIEHAAEVEWSRDYDDGSIRFQQWALEGNPPDPVTGSWGDHEAEEAIVHELLHVAVRPMRRYWRAIQEGNHLHRDVEALAEDVRRQGEEETVDRVARALVAAFRP